LLQIVVVAAKAILLCARRDGWQSSIYNVDFAARRASQECDDVC